MENNTENKTENNCSEKQSSEQPVVKLGWANDVISILKVSEDNFVVTIPNTGSAIKIVLNKQMLNQLYKQVKKNLN